MTTRAFFIFSALFCYQLMANPSAGLVLVGRVFPQVSVSVVSDGGKGALGHASNYRISTNMPQGTYKVFEHKLKNRSHLEKKKSYRQLVVEAN
jgi:hypothetical protein